MAHLCRVCSRVDISTFPPSLPYPSSPFSLSTYLASTIDRLTEGSLNCESQKQPRCLTPSLFEAAWGQGLFGSGVRSGHHLATASSPTATATTSFLPDAELIPKRRGACLSTAPHYSPTEQHSKSTREYNQSYVNTTTATEGTPLAEGLPEEGNAIEKIDREQKLATCFPPKFKPTNQIRALGPTGARVSGRLLRVYKAGPQC